MAEVIKIRFEYRDFYTNKSYKFDLTHDRTYGCVYSKNKQALKDFKHYCNTNERLYNLGKTINRFERITLIRKTGTPSYVYELGHKIMTYEEYCSYQKHKKHKDRHDRYSLKIEE